MPSITFHVTQELKDDFDDRRNRENKKKKHEDRQTKTDMFINFMRQFAYGRKTK